METNVACTTPMKPKVSHARKVVRKAKHIPEGYMSLDESGSISHRKLDEAYAKIQGDSEQ